MRRGARRVGVLSVRQGHVQGMPAGRRRIGRNAWEGTELRWLSMFSGVGGFELGLELAGRSTGAAHETVAACDNDPYAVSVYARRFPGVRMFACDAERLDVDALPEFDAVCAGFPCRTFSTAGRRLGIEGDGGACFFEVARAARERRPRILFLENVPGLLGNDGGRTFARMLAALDDIRYDAVWQCVDCSNWVPQARTRLFIVGCPRESGIDPAEVLPLGAIHEVPAGPQRKARRPRPRLYGKDRAGDCLAGTIDAGYTKRGGSRTMICEPADACSHGGEAVMVQDVWPGSRKEQRGPNLRRGDAFTLCAGKRKSGVLHVGGGVDLEAVAMAAASGEKDECGLWGDAMLDDMCRLRTLMPVEAERLQGLPDDHTRWGADGTELSDTRRINLVGRAVPPPAVCAIAERLPAEAERH